MKDNSNDIINILEMKNNIKIFCIKIINNKNKS